MKKTLVFTLMTLLLLLLVGRLAGGRHEPPSPHVAAQWKDVNFTRIKPATGQNAHSSGGKALAVKILTPPPAQHADISAQNRTP